MEVKQALCKKHGQTRLSKYRNGDANRRGLCNLCGNERVKRLLDEKRQRAYDTFGSCCKICGYDKCKSALEYHHLDPSQKEITPAKVFSRSWERIIIELKKCVLLCSNCHREVHAGITKL